MLFALFAKNDSLNSTLCLLLTTAHAGGEQPSQPSPTKAYNCSIAATSPPSQAMSLQDSCRTVFCCSWILAGEVEWGGCI